MSKVLAFVPRNCNKNTIKIETEDRIDIVDGYGDGIDNKYYKNIIDGVTFFDFDKELHPAPYSFTVMISYKYKKKIKVGLFKEKIQEGAKTVELEDNHSINEVLSFLNEEYMEVDIYKIEIISSFWGEIYYKHHSGKGLWLFEVNNGYA